MTHAVTTTPQPPRDALRAVEELSSYAPAVDGLRPWVFVVSGHSIEVRAGLDWAATPGDPLDRRLHIGAGVVVELARLAIRDLDLSCVVRLPPRCDGGSGHELGTLTVGHESPATPLEHRLVAAVPRLAQGLPSAYSADDVRAAVGVAGAAAAERGCWLRVLERPGDRSAVAGLVRGFSDVVPHVSALVEDDTLLLVGTDDDSPRSWLRSGRALASALLVLTDAGMHAEWSAAITGGSRMQAHLRRELGLLGSPQLMLAVA